MRYGYLETCDDTDFKLLSLEPRQITLTSSGYSTFILYGSRNSLDRWLRQFQETRVRLGDPLGNQQPTLTVEVRRQFNLFFSPCLIILRPTVVQDLLQGDKICQPLCDRFGLPLCKKLIIAQNIKLKSLTSILGRMRPSTCQVGCIPVPTSSYQLGRASLNTSQLAILSRHCRPVTNRAPAYSASEFDLSLPPSYTVSQATTLPLPAYNYII
ncbi:hypothetical protein DSO57_1007723 [Entomophthora muscae]|uniref:Uncharacterized protein n=1 Tax=Entomophthora muscae TaxID=34485 RepID=A0ACC2SWF5_9FUNG|nr:hypothetical protein DSO57_1007723 [Entomophthora muscae]